ncbi:hypothetical protein CLOM_g6681 [Closterium sp. NIES-68]|nr:hypothetical protein CLOM_g6681 [Closterium sp. NIES-68]GJP80848.1 hypothetical protein CLOP_g11047 [Closterium sp. NIES-67]
MGSSKDSILSARRSGSLGSGSAAVADDAAAEAGFRAAMRFIRKGPSASLQFVIDGKRAELYALETQAVHGPCVEASANPPVLEDPSSRRRREAWVALGQMPAAEAKRQLVALLSLLIPDWRDWEGGSRGKGGACGGHVEAGKSRGTVGGQGDRQEEDSGCVDVKRDGEGDGEQGGGLADQLLRRFAARTNVSLTALRARL